jgi:hypothetical protein
MKIIRVFPRKTSATHDDEDVRIACPPGLFDEADEVHIPVLFTWDKQTAERLAELWEQVAPVRVGGPAYDDPGGLFVPGLYVKKGYVMTSRGCPNRCWFCSVPKREGTIREIPTTEGHNLLDSNILACSDNHIKAVFMMLEQGKKLYKKPVEFTGGLEAKRMKLWVATSLKELKPKQLFFAYDTPDDLDPLIEAGKLLVDAGFKTHPSSHVLRCYVLCGFKGDTFEKAEMRMKQTLHAGFTPMAMLYRDQKGDRDKQLMRWQRVWARPSIIHTTK